MDVYLINELWVSFQESTDIEEEEEEEKVSVVPMADP